MLEFQALAKKDDQVGLLAKSQLNSSSQLKWRAGEKYLQSRYVYLDNNLLEPALCFTELLV